MVDSISSSRGETGSGFYDFTQTLLFQQGVCIMIGRGMFETIWNF